MDTMSEAGRDRKSRPALRQPRDRKRALQVYVNAEERTAITERAELSGMRVSNYLRAAGVGAQIQSVLDLEAVATLAKISGDQGRLGGLLKMYLQDQNPDRRVAERLLAEIETVQADLKAAAKRIRT
jgi:hypothetical protein